MTLLDRARVYRVFSQALEHPEAQRSEFLQRECGDDLALRAEVDGLLRIATRDGADTKDFLAPPRSEVDLTGTALGRFRLVERIGQGGMGVVYRGERLGDVPQTVAVKVLSGAVSPSARVRFQREAEHMARLDHPAVARLVDAGFDQGRAFIAMEFVRGECIDDFCVARRPTVQEMVRLVAQIAEAVAAAHRLLIVHSDIKPANVLVTTDGTPRLIDFGISTVLREAADPSAPTSDTGRLFSPGYAAPEQIMGGPVTVGTDVFGIGALAYRIFTGGSIFPDAKDPVAYVHAITRREVDLPSRVARASGASSVDPRALRGDLDAILCKALERDPARRYDSATALQADLERSLEDLPVRARRQTPSYRVAKFLRRNTVAASLTSLLVVCLGAGGAFLAWQSHLEALARGQAASRGEFLEGLLRSADPRGGRRDVSVAELLDAAAAELDHRLGNEPLVAASMLGLIAETDCGLGRYPEGLSASDRQLALLRVARGGSAELGKALKTRGEILRELGRWAEAKPVLSEAVSLLRQAGSPSDLCAALEEYGAVLAHSLKEKEAEAIFLEEIAIESRGSRELQARRIYPYNSLGVILGEQGRYAESVRFARKALDLARQVLPAEHPDLLNVETTTASVLLSEHRGAEAEPLLREVLAAQTRILGGGHRDTLLTQLGLVDALDALGRDAEAAPLALSAARELDRLLGPDNLYALRAWFLYGTAACKSHQEEAGLEAMRRAEAGRRRTGPAGAWTVYSTLVGVGSCLYRMHRYPEAESALLEGVEGLEAAKGPRFQRTQDGYTLLRDTSQALGRTEEAARWAQKLEPQ